MIRKNYYLYICVPAEMVLIKIYFLKIIIPWHICLTIIIYKKKLFSLSCNFILYSNLNPYMTEDYVLSYKIFKLSASFVAVLFYICLLYFVFDLLNLALLFFIS